VHGATIRLDYTTQSRAIDERFSPNMRVNTRHAHALDYTNVGVSEGNSQSNLRVSIDGSRGLFRS
jgi:hypothetical protein